MTTTRHAPMTAIDHVAVEMGLLRIDNGTLRDELRDLRTELAAVRAERNRLMQIIRRAGVKIDHERFADIK